MAAKPGPVAGLARLGPHFALEVHPGSAPGAGWQPFGALLGDLDGRVAAVRAALAAASGRRPDEVELRIAVSMTQLGLAGRLLCPALGVALLTGGLLDLDPARLCWRPGPGSTVVLSVPADAIPGGVARSGPAGEPGDGWSAAGARGVRAVSAPAAVPEAGSTEAPGGVPDDRLAEALAQTVVGGPVRLLVEAAGRYGVSAQVLWGNVASVLHGVPALVGATAADLLGPAEALVAAVLDRPPLRGTSKGGPGVAFRRRSCCLVYRLVPAAQAGDARTAVCGDCVLQR